MNWTNVAIQTLQIVLRLLEQYMRSVPSNPNASNQQLVDKGHEIKLLVRSLEDELHRIGENHNV